METGQLHLKKILIGKLHLDENHQQDYLGGLKIRMDLKELMFLSTCNRVEFVVNTDREIAPEFLSDLFYSINSRLTKEDLDALRENIFIMNYHGEIDLPGLI
jgi:glutamyl-tRNA reductase